MIGVLIAVLVAALAYIILVALTGSRPRRRLTRAPGGPGAPRGRPRGPDDG